MGRRRKRKKEKKRRQKRSQTNAAATPQSGRDSKRDFTALALAAISVFLIWLSMPGPGRGIWWLAWIALVPMIWLVQSPSLPHKLGRQVWIASLLFWLVTLHFVRLPFWALWFGWFALAAYLSVYLPLFVLTSRTLVHRFKIPTVVAAPVVFTGLEWIRVNFLSGFGLACLSHSQYRSPATMQIAEYFGAYGVTFAIVLVSAAGAVASSFIWKRLNTAASIPIRLGHGALAAVALFAVFGYGSQRLSKDVALRKSAEPHKHLKVALIQSSIDTLLVRKSKAEIIRNFENRRDLTHSARLVAKDLDLIVWPESSLAYWDYLSGIDATATKEELNESQWIAWQTIVGDPTIYGAPVPLLVGSTTLNPEAEEIFNSSIIFDTQGNVAGRYYKNHLVLFGEYFPVVHSIPVLKEFIKAFRTINAGTKFARFNVKDVSIGPNICFETTVPQFIRRQINTLEESGEDIEVLVNVTNDGWFFGTSCLDLHLACNTFRAVEMRKPLLVSANTGFSAHIDEFGRHVQVGPRRKEAELICNVRIPLPVKTVYRSWGAWVPCAMGWLTLCVGVVGYFSPPKATKEHLPSGSGESEEEV